MQGMKVTIPLCVASLLLGNCASSPKPARLADRADIAHEQARADGESLAFIEAVDKYEVEAALSLLKNFHHQKVRAFAEFMISEHGKNLKEAQNVAKETHIHPNETQAIAAFKEKAAQELAFLKPLKGIYLDKAYIDAMVTGHEEVLKQIDNYLRDVHNEHIKALLEKTKPHVEHHLEAAKAIQQELKNS